MRLSNYDSEETTETVGTQGRQKGRHHTRNNEKIGWMQRYAEVTIPGDIGISMSDPSRRKLRRPGTATSSLQLPR